jgi:hypothetical protein
LGFTQKYRKNSEVALQASAIIVPAGLCKRGVLFKELIGCQISKTPDREKTSLAGEWACCAIG